MGRFINSQVNIPLEKITESVPTIDSNHGQIHEKTGFSLSGTLSVGAADTGAIHFKVPVDTKATITVDMTVANSDLTYTAVDFGTYYNDVTVTHVTAGNNTPLTVVVTAKAIVVNLATGATGTVTTTANHVVAAIAASPQASALVVATKEGTGAGLVNAAGAATLTGGVRSSYIHFQALSFSANAGPCTVSLMEKYTMDVTAAAAADTIVARNHHRISPPASTLVTKSHVDVTATLVEGGSTLATVIVPGATTGQTRVGASSGQSEEWVLAPGNDYLITMLATDATVFGYYLFWYEQSGA